jgi:hypothetical protein
MDKEQQDTTKRYVMIELSCDQMACSPCTYPNCQRYARLQPKSKKFAGTIKSVVTKELPVNSKEEKVMAEIATETAPTYPYQVNRYILTELSCSNAKCSPCTYPNCQRFSRSNKKIKIPQGSPVVNVTELKGGKKIEKIIEEPKKS